MKMPWRCASLFSLMLLASNDAGAAELGTIARQIGLTPTAMAAAGVAAADVSAMLDRIASADQERQALANAWATRESCLGVLKQKQTDLEAAPGSESARAALVAARQAVGSATVSVEVAEAAVRAIAVQTMATQVTDKLAAFRESSKYTVPAQFRVVVRTHTQWRQLEAALASERQHVSEQQAVPPTVASLLSAARSEGSVAAAEAGIAANLPNLEMAYDAR